ncbi:MAG TPA: hypothetical protein VGR37_14995 [Longimicrobiaceae bacterium]|nr:hypothetical protein [Longimicrobiaceae bacterium]
MRRIRTLLFPALAAAVVLAACGGEEAEVGEEGVDAPIAAEAPAAEAGVAAGGLGEWDTDRDTRLASNEFGGWINRGGIYKRWAGDTEGIDANEFGTGALGIWDRDNDNRVTEAEWTEGTRGWFGEGENAGTFAEWDANRDTFLDAGELGEGFNRTGVFRRWDRNANNLLEENEFGEGAFGVWDRNRDRFIDETEWGAGFGDWGA